MIPVFSMGPMIGYHQLPDGRKVPVYGKGKLINLIRTADELTKMFMLCVQAEVHFAHEKRPNLVRRAYAKAKCYSNMALYAGWKENRRLNESVPSPKLADLIFQTSHARATEIFEENFNDAIIAQCWRDGKSNSQTLASRGE